MKKRLVLLLIAMTMVLGGCGGKEKSTETAVPSVSVSQTEESTEEQLEEVQPIEKENNESIESTNSVEEVVQVETEEITENNKVNVYKEQMGLVYKALSEKWDIGQCFDNDISSLISNHREDNPLDSVGYALEDLDGDGKDELLISAVSKDFSGGMLYDVYAAPNGEVIHVLSGHARNRYYLQWLEEGTYMIANEASNSAFNSAWYYYTLDGGQLKLSQGVVFNAAEDENNPWFSTYDTDWDSSNDTHDIDGVAEDIIESYTKQYTTLEYTPFSAYDTVE